MFLILKGICFGEKLKPHFGYNPALETNDYSEDEELPFLQRSFFRKVPKEYDATKSGEDIFQVKRFEQSKV